MIKLFRYLKGSAILYAIIAPIMMCIEVFMDLNQPRLMANIIDVGIANGDLNYVLMVGGKMILIAFIGLIGGASCCIFSAMASMSMGGNLRQGIFDKIQTLAFGDIDKFKTGSLITRLTNDVTQVQNMVLMGLRIMVRAPLMCIGGIIMAFSLSRQLSSVFLIIIPVIFIGVVFIVNKSVPMFSKVQENIDKVNLVMRESILGMRVVKAFNMEKKQKERFKDSNEELMNSSIKAQNTTILLWPLITLVMNLTVVAVLWFGGNLVNIGGIETGKIMAFINYLIQIMNSLMMVIMIIINLSRAKVSAKRINELLDSTPAIKYNDEGIYIENYDVEFKNVHFKYNPSGECVLKNINFKVNEGQVVGIIGATGSGKSSLVSLIPRLYDTTEGRVYIGGVDVRELNIKELRENIGIVLQENILFSGTIKDNIGFGVIETTEEELKQVSIDAQAYEFIDGKEDGYGSIVEQRGKNLSGGQKQRLSIARTLIKNPKILILDDSSSALDMTTEARLQRAIRERMKGSTLFIIAQRITAVMDADQIIVLDEGEISGIGNHEELLKTNEIYSSIAVSQLGEKVV